MSWFIFKNPKLSTSKSGYNPFISGGLVPENLDLNGSEKIYHSAGGTYVDQAIHGQVFSNIHTSSSIID